MLLAISIVDLIIRVRFCAPVMGELKDRFAVRPVFAMAHGLGRVEGQEVECEFSFFEITPRQFQ